MPILLTHFKKIDEKRTPTNTSYEISSILIPKSDKDITIKENYRQTSLINLHVKILKKLISN